MAKNDNMLAILWMLNSGAKVTASAMAEKLEVNIRTIYRYIDSLCASGVPIVADTGQNGGYSLLSTFVEAPLFFDMDEQKALMHAAVFAKEAGYPFGKALNSATQKLRLYANTEQAKNLNQHLDGLEVIHRDIDASVKKTLEVLELAAAGSNSVKLTYRSGRAKKASSRILDPYGVLYWNNKWYTVGFCHRRKEIRSFRAERILAIETMVQTFDRPKDFSAKTYFMENLLEHSDHKESMVLVKVRGRSEALDDLCIHWFLGHHLRERTEEEATFMIDKEALRGYVPYFLLSYGKAIEVTEPQFLKARLVSVTSELLAYYRK